ncbi:manganese efflux pump [Sodalis-like endosymbiont of Proechinophthirus fluctus]|uniref:manganese efflux pump n=1 Tax=Sodalis-like endosymbiont of Proechinophthirus fluctus TaxID=1462730 RepID=UPI0034E93BD3
MQAVIIGEHSLGMLVATTIATSLDALAIGVADDVSGQYCIVHIELLIALATFLISTIGMLLGRFMGPCLGNKAEIISNFILLASAATSFYR